jgi:peroxiredoxin
MVRRPSVGSVFLNNNSVKLGPSLSHDFVQCNKGRVKVESVGFLASAAAGPGDATKYISRRDLGEPIGVDRDRAPAHYESIVTFRSAPEARGTLGVTAVAARYGAVAVFCFLGLPVCAGAAELQPWTAGPQPTFSLPNSAGANTALESARGHIVLVHFFATWCESCREELPALNRLAVRGNGSVTVLAIAVADADRSVRRFFANAPVDFPVLLDRDRAVAKAWQVATLPTSFVLDASLQPRLVVQSDYAWDTVDPGKFFSSSVTANANASN